jgi:hypothetical protein
MDCARTEFEQCLAFIETDGLQPGCPPISGCENPEMEAGWLAQPRFREVDGVFQLLDGCGGVLPVGFESCQSGEADALPHACACACELAP